MIEEIPMIKQEIQAVLNQDVEEKLKEYHAARNQYRIAEMAMRECAKRYAVARIASETFQNHGKAET